MTTQKLTAFEQVEIQMAMVVPLLRDLQEILGDEVVLDALRARLERRIDAARARARSDVPFARRMDRIDRDFGVFAEGGVLEYASRRTAEGGLEIDVTGCRYAELMERLGARDLGELLLCSEDEVAVAAAGTRLERTQTKMQCASHCDFRFCDANGHPDATS